MCNDNTNTTINMDYLNLAILRTQQALIMHRNGLKRLSCTTKALARNALLNVRNKNARYSQSN